MTVSSARRPPVGGASAPTRGGLVTMIGFAYLVVSSLRYTVDPDMWWHLRTGGWILDHGFPGTDVFSFTVPDNEWITHEWLTQVAMRVVHLIAGLPGLMVVFGALAVATFTLVYRLCRGQRLIALAVTLVAMRASIIAWGVRPQLVNLLLLAVFLTVLEGAWSRARRPNRLWVLVPLAALWANLHSGFFTALALLGGVAVAESLQHRIDPTHPRALDGATRSTLWKVAGASFLATIANPAGPKLWLYPFETLASDAQQAYIAEWVSPDFHDPYMWPFAALLIGGAVTFAASRLRPTITEILLFAGTGFAGLVSLRHIGLFAVVAAPIVARHLTSAAETTRVGAVLARFDTAPLRSGRLVRLTVGAALVLAVGVVAVDRFADNDTAIALDYPVAAVEYLQQTGLDGERGYNEYGWGGYLIWHGFEVFIDGRADVYGDEMLHRWNAIERGADRWAAELDRYDLTWALVETDDLLSRLLDTSADWTLDYEQPDGAARIYLRT